jgi:hypothetical protein
MATVSTIMPAPIAAPPLPAPVQTPTAAVDAVPESTVSDLSAVPLASSEISDARTPFDSAGNEHDGLDSKRNSMAPQTRAMSFFSGLQANIMRELEGIDDLFIGKTGHLPPPPPLPQSTGLFFFFYSSSFRRSGQSRVMQIVLIVAIIFRTIL